MPKALFNLLESGGADRRSPICGGRRF